MSKTLKVTISGSYRSANRQIESFDGVVGYMPNLAEDKVNQMAIRRYARVWVAQAKNKDGDPKFKYIANIRQVFVDSIEDNEEKPNAVLSYVGKDIMEMNFEELQDLAAANDLNGIPLYKVGSLVTARRIAFSEYAIKVLQLAEYEAKDKKQKFNLYDHRVAGFNPKKFEPIIADDIIRRNDEHKISLEEGLELEAKNIKLKAGKVVEDDGEAGTGAPRMTFDQLKLVAAQRNVVFNKGISYENLYKKVYGQAA